MSGQDEPLDYASKKAFFGAMLTLFGRKPVLEALQADDVAPFRLHLAERNERKGIINDIVRLAEQRSVEIRYHSRDALARISRNRRQDQGVALDVSAPRYRSISELQPGQAGDLIALENVTNPQNVGMIIRAVGASPARGIILPKQGCAKLDALVIKASAGTLFKVPVYHCEVIQDGLRLLKDIGFKIYGLSSHAERTIANISMQDANIFVLGNETEGLSAPMTSLCDELVKIPLNNGVESLNVSSAASIVAFRAIYNQTPEAG